MGQENRRHPCKNYRTKTKEAPQTDAFRRSLECETEGEAQSINKQTQRVTNGKPYRVYMPKEQRWRKLWTENPLMEHRYAKVALRKATTAANASIGITAQYAPENFATIRY